LARIFESLPTFILPIMVVNMLGAEQNAYFFIAWVISGGILGILHSILHSLFAEGSYSIKDFRTNIVKTLKFMLFILFLSMFATFLFGKNLLRLFGHGYSEHSYELLILFIFAIFLQVINETYIVKQRVYKNIKPVLFAYLLLSSLFIVLSYILVPSLGILGIGYARIMSNLMITIILSFLTFLKNKVRKLAMSSFIMLHLTSNIT